MIPRLKEKYESSIVSSLQKKLEFGNKLMVPKLTKIVLNMGLGLDGNDKKKLKNCRNFLFLMKGGSLLFFKEISETFEG